MPGLQDNTCWWLSGQEQVPWCSQPAEGSWCDKKDWATSCGGRATCYQGGSSMFVGPGDAKLWCKFPVSKSVPRSILYRSRIWQYQRLHESSTSETWTHGLPPACLFKAAHTRHYVYSPPCFPANKNKSWDVISSYLQSKKHESPHQVPTSISFKTWLDPIADSLSFRCGSAKNGICNLQVWFYLECLTTTGLLSLQQVTPGFVDMLKDKRIPEEVACQAMSLLLASRTKLAKPVKQFRNMVRDIMYDGRQLHALGR